MEVPKGQVLEAVVNALGLKAQVLPHVWVHVQLPVASLLCFNVFLSLKAMIQ